MKTEVLEPEDIYKITHRKKFKAQIRALESMGIEVKPRPDGSPLVNLDHFNRVTGAEGIDNNKKPTVKLDLG